MIALLGRLAPAGLASLAVLGLPLLARAEGPLGCEFGTGTITIPAAEFLRYVVSETLSAFSGHGATSAHCGMRTFGLAFLATVALVAITLGRMRHATERRRLDLARRLIEQGLQPPPELVAGTVLGDLRKGVVLIAAGLGLLGAALTTGDRALGPAGLIPGFIGIGYLVSYRLGTRRRPP